VDIATPNFFFLAPPLIRVVEEEEGRTKHVVVEDEVQKTFLIVLEGVKKQI